MRQEAPRADRGTERGPGAATRERAPRPRRRLAALLALAAAGLVAGCERGPEAAPTRPTPEVGTVTMKAERIVLTRELPGRTAPFLVAEVRPQVSGILLERHFVEGRDVEAGRPLYQIDPAPFQAAVDSAEANLEAAKSAAGRARAAVQASLAGVGRQEATVALARLNHARVGDLFRDKVVSASERDQAATDLQVAEASLRAAEAQVESDRAAVAAAESAIEQAEAALVTSKIQLDHTKITAPIGGRIGRSTVTVGALVTAYQPVPLAVIQQLDPIYVDVTQASVDLLRFRRDLAGGGLRRDREDEEKVRLKLEDGTPYPLEGTLQFRDVTVDPTTGSVVLRMVFPNPDLVLLPGMYARAVVEEGVVEAAVLAPQQGVTRDARGNPLAMVVSEAGQVEQRALTVDRAIGDRWLVTKGLSPGDRLIVDGLQKVRPGVPVRVVPLDAEAR